MRFFRSSGRTCALLLLLGVAAVCCVEATSRTTPLARLRDHLQLQTHAQTDNGDNGGVFHEQASLVESESESEQIPGFHNAFHSEEGGIRVITDSNEDTDESNDNLSPFDTPDYRRKLADLGLHEKWKPPRRKAPVRHKSTEDSDTELPSRSRSRSRPRSNWRRGRSRSRRRVRKHHRARARAPRDRHSHPRYHLHNSVSPIFDARMHRLIKQHERDLAHNASGQTKAGEPIKEQAAVAAAADMNSNSPVPASNQPSTKHYTGPTISVVWEMESAGCTGFAIEAQNLLVAFARGKVEGIRMAVIARGHDYCPGTRLADQLLLEEMKNIDVRQWTVDVWISHRPPNEWPHFPYYQGDDGRINMNIKPRYIVGRSMFESTMLPQYWRDNLVARPGQGGVHEVWVPARFLVEAFRQNTAGPVLVMPEAIDTTLYNPDRVVKLRSGEFGLHLDSRFNFYSVFKWEHRKGWDVLLDAYWAEFKRNEPVTLTLQTYIAGAGDNAHSSAEISRLLRQHAASRGIDIDKSAVVNLITDFVPMSDMPRMYSSMDCFVLPTRGEGWGLPIIEAMSMGTPTIATNYSGPVEFMTDSNSYLLHVDSFDNEGYANPSVAHLRQLMRFVATHPKEIKEKGAQARKDIQSKFNPTAIAEVYAKRIRDIAASLS